MPLAACRVSPNFVDLSKYSETAKRMNRIKMDAEITTNYVKKIDKAKVERWLK